ncbi:anhydro-N-acetylmuramic acid kinase [Siphonobacter sp. SORGH_AS_0500]|uniref:anhydro-N-acetylmuramic acid kinase n=1 Tax=Siphonobacter sp. SORGH_AS_0500 TaxID=1864824 RepID=UPI00350F284B
MRVRGARGETQVRVLNFKTVPFDESIKDEIRKVFARREIDFQQLALLNPWIGNLHGSIVLDCLKEWNVNSADIDCIASHGQTVFHAPKILHGLAKFPNATLQIGDGDHMAVTTGIITLSDFRQKHCAAGGEGAPLAVYGDYLIFSKPGENRILLNMGGIANFTYLPANLNADEVFATDTGTGNTLIDAVTRKYFDLPYDENAEIAQRGVINEALVTELKNDPFFQKTFPKTTGPELFNLDYLQRAQQRSQTEELSPEDVLATLTRFSAETIAKAVKQSLDWHESSTQWVIYASGGGVHNPLLLAHIQELLPKFSLRKTDELGILGDAKEAVLFATLANEALAGGKTNFGHRQGVPSVSMGKISFPH